MTSKSFETWDHQEVEEVFGIKSKRNLPLLEEWLAAKTPIEGHLKEELNYLKELLIDNADVWNEDELKYFFISPLISHVRYKSDLYKSFTQRTITAEFPALGFEVTGRVEFMLAKGGQRPKSPFFFIHEYKQERKRTNDPKGQLLVSMIAARAKNQTDFPDYGCFVIGRFWFFVVLVGDEYAESLAFDATKEQDLHQIFSALMEIKNIALPLYS